MPRRWSPTKRYYFRKRDEPPSPKDFLRVDVCRDLAVAVPTEVGERGGKRLRVVFVRKRPRSSGPKGMVTAVQGKSGVDVLNERRERRLVEHHVLMRSGALGALERALQLPSFVAVRSPRYASSIDNRPGPAGPQLSQG
jgi:hypothetical protein